MSLRKKTVSNSEQIFHGEGILGKYAKQ